jgi:hypothetical protein
MKSLSTSDITRIQLAVDRYREKNPEAYKMDDDVELVVQSLDSAGMYGSLAGKYGARLSRIKQIVNQE